MKNHLLLILFSLSMILGSDEFLIQDTSSESASIIFNIGEYCCILLFTVGEYCCILLFTVGEYRVLLFICEFSIIGLKLLWFLFESIFIILRYSLLVESWFLLFKFKYVVSWLSLLSISFLFTFNFLCKKFDELLFWSYCCLYSSCSF